MLILFTILQFGFNSGHYLANGNIPIADSLGNLQNFSNSIRHNQMNLSYLRPYEIQDFDLISIESHIKSAQIGISLNHFGFKLYKESMISLYRPFQISSFGIGFKYNIRLINIIDYGNKTEHSASFQISYPLFNRFNIQVTSNHLLSSQRSFEKVYNLSFAYIGTGNLFQISFTKNYTRYSPGIHFHQYIEYIQLITSYQFNEKQLNSGLSINLESYHFLFAFSFHNELGLSRSLSIAFFY